MKYTIATGSINGVDCAHCGQRVPPSSTHTCGSDPLPSIVRRLEDELEGADGGRADALSLAIEIVQSGI